MQEFKVYLFFKKVVFNVVQWILSDFVKLHKYGNTDPSQSELRNSLQVAEVKICSHVSHGKALHVPTILEIAREVWP